MTGARFATEAFILVSLLRPVSLRVHQAFSPWVPRNCPWRKAAWAWRCLFTSD